MIHLEKRNVLNTTNRYMKTTPFLFVLLVFSGYRAATQPCKTFDCTLQQAILAYEAKDYRTAYEGFKAAKNFKRANTAEANAWMDKTFDALEKQQKTDAEKVRQSEIVNKTNVRALERLYFYHNRFGLAYDNINNLYGFVDKAGNTTIPFKYNVLWPFDEQGFAHGVVNEYNSPDAHYLIDTLGNEYRLATDLNQLDSNTTALDLRKRALSVLPDSVCKYTALKVLLLSNNKLKRLPDSIGALTNLHTLYLNDNQISSLPEGFGQLEALQTLTLYRNELTALPAGFVQLENLQYVDMSFNQIMQLPTAFGHLKNLISFDLGYNVITHLPTDFGQLKKLKSLMLHSNQLTSLPTDFGQLTNLKVLNLSNNQISSLPIDFGQLANLESFSMLSNQLTSLPENFGQLKKLHRLELSGNQLTHLPETFGQLNGLTDLNLSANQLHTLPESFGQLPHLQTFSAHSNQITSLPSGFGQLPQLQNLYLSNNQLTQLPDGFGQLAQLESFELMHNLLSSLPPDFGQLKKLQDLILFDNQLSNLPAEFGRMASLQTLYLNHNQLNSLTDEIGQLTQLENLILSENQLTSLPASICNLKNLKMLGYSKNPIKEVPECFASMAAQPPIYEVVEAAAEAGAPDSTYLLLAQQLLIDGYVQAYNDALAAVQSDSMNANLYFNLSYYALFAGDYTTAIESALKTLKINPLAIKVETNLALGYVFSDQYDKAEAIYQKWKGKKFEADDKETADIIFLKDISDLEELGIQHKDFEKVKRLFRE